MTTLDLSNNWRSLGDVLAEVIVRIERARTPANSDYAAYLRSEEWAAKRVQVMHRCGALCEGCQDARAVQVHHLTYDNLFQEPLSELQALCNACHEEAHHLRKPEAENV